MNSKILILIIFFTTIIKIHSQNSNKYSHSVSITIPEVALLDLESSKDKNLKFDIKAPTEAGSAINISNINYDMWINYSSIVNSSSTSRNVGVQITDGKVADGLQLNIYAWRDVRKGEGQMGKSPTSLLKLTDSEVTNLITGIGSAYTGNGPDKGHRVLYYLTKSNDKEYYSKLNSDQSDILTITYTLTDN
ncbi:hypothetical protein [Lutibacter citreus]|uniref:hypothetical protein n=1 Tax=Lutibacter citreus TaxID=2138210 RepID=UPI000DBE9D30|nr:hypothetical protein [Lutibacter citreus]